jgi:quercetin dioxygenase-like cupin family protein
MKTKQSRKESAMSKIAKPTQKKSADDMSAPIMAAMLASLTPIAPPSIKSAAIKNKLLAKISGATPVIVHNSLHADRSAWTRVAPLIETQVLFDNGNTSAQLVRFLPGAVMRGHRHQYDEAAMVMEGWCMVGEDRLSRGDYQMVPAGASHGDIISPEGCVLFLHGPSYSRHSEQSARI